MEEISIFKSKMPEYMKKRQYDVFNDYRKSIVPYSTEYILSRIEYFEQFNVKNLTKYLKSLNYPLLYRLNKKWMLIDALILESPDATIPFDVISKDLICAGFVHPTGYGKCEVKYKVPKLIPVYLPIYYMF